MVEVGNGGVRSLRFDGGVYYIGSVITQPSAFLRISK